MWFLCWEGQHVCIAVMHRTGYWMWLWWGYLSPKVFTKQRRNWLSCCKALYILWGECRMCCSFWQQHQCFNKTLLLSHLLHPRALFFQSSHHKWVSMSTVRFLSVEWRLLYGCLKGRILATSTLWPMCYQNKTLGSTQHPPDMPIPAFVNDHDMVDDCVFCWFNFTQNTGEIFDLWTPVLPISLAVCFLLYSFPLWDVSALGSPGTPSRPKLPCHSKGLHFKSKCLCHISS